jgi:RNA polymerase sigma factor (sigma-70 family)
MFETQWLAERFEEHRPRLRAVAYRMLGSLTEADDAVQEAWLRLSRTDAGEIENLAGWLTTVVGRVSLNMLRSRRVRGEEPWDVQVPEPILDPIDGVDPDHEAVLADSVGLALLVVLATLSPAERLAFVLHDMFAVAFDEIAVIADRSPEAARQLASRARRRVRGSQVPDADLATQRKVVDAFLAAARGGAAGRPRSGGDWGGAGGGGGGPSGPHLHPARHGHQAGPRQRGDRLCLDAARGAVLGGGLHHQGREDRRDRHSGRPRPSPPPRPVRPRGPG